MSMLNAISHTRFWVTIVRIAIGWHFLYEGLSKWFAQGWSAQSYLANSIGFASGFYQFLASHALLLQIVDVLNIAGLVGIGLCLFLGVFTRYAALAGVLLLTLYYFAYPPFGAALSMQTEGSLFIVNKIFLEAVVLLLLAVLKEKGYGVDRLIPEPSPPAEPAEADTAHATGRREALKNLVSLPLLGLMSWGAFDQRRRYTMDGTTGATIKIGGADLKELKGSLPKGKLGKLEMGRLVLGGNLIGGWAHSRDLLYVPSLFKAYNTEKKVFETLMLAEQAGVDAINIGFPSSKLLQKYKRITGSRIKVITQVAPDMQNQDYFRFIHEAIDDGVDVIQVQGNHCDWLVRDQKTEVVGFMLDEIRRQGYVAGLGAHSVDALIACEDAGILPDYYMKTMHHDRYWSAHPMENRVAFEVDGPRSPDHNQFHDNIFCLFPDRTVEFVERSTIPVMGFKVLAAGAIPPEDGFRWAFENGADFICVGMFDFQIVNNVNTTLDILADLPKRKRAWYA